MLLDMKKATLYGFKSEKEKILIALQKCGEFMIVSPQKATAQAKQDDHSAQDALAAVKFIDSFAKKKPMFQEFQQITFQEFIENDEQSVLLTNQATQIEKSIAENKSAIVALNATKAQILPWQELEIPIDQISKTKRTNSYIGFVDPLRLNEFSQLINEDAEFEFTSFQALQTVREGVPVFVVTLFEKNDQHTYVFDRIRKSGFENCVLPKTNKTPAEFLVEIEEKIKTLEMEIETQKQLGEQMQTHLEAIKLRYDKLSAQKEREAQQSFDTSETFCFQGWVPLSKTQKVEDVLKQTTDFFAIDFQDPDENDIVPSVTKNNATIAQFEVVTNLYSRPSPSGLDPNTIMAPFYALFFGMMVSDAGYGVFMTLALLFYKFKFANKKKLPKLMNVLLAGSLSTIFWGIMFGGYFGMEWFKPVMFSPMNEPMKMLILCYALGIIHLFVGVGTKIYIEMRRKNFANAIFDNLAWIILIIGLIMLVVPTLKLVATILSIAGAGMILLFAARDKKGATRLLGGLGSLYSVTGYLSDVLSYSRLFALGLATGVIAMVVNTICTLIFGSMPIVGPIIAAIIFIGGHIFNISINYLGAFVHDSRLQYIEFFGKFYEGGGAEFTPLCFNNKYTDLI